MEALWDLEDKLNLSTREAATILSCIAISVFGVCIATFTCTIKRKAREKQLISQDPEEEEEGEEVESQNEPEMLMKKPSGSPGYAAVKNVLLYSVRWSSPSRSRKEKLVPLLFRRESGGVGGGGGGVAEKEVVRGLPSRNSSSPVWQRPILMGEKCELPRFSGLILYDERGRPVHQHHHLHGQSNTEAANDQERTPMIAKTTLKDLL